MMRLVPDGECRPAIPTGLATLAKKVFDGEDLTALNWQLIERMVKEPPDAAVLMDLSIIEQLIGNPADARALQAQALEVGRLYRRPASGATGEKLRLLAFLAPGDFMANTPLEFLLDGSGVTLDMLYVLPGQALPDELPDHDIAFVAVGESDDNRAVLAELGHLVLSWPRPVLNRPERIARLSRNGAWELLKAAPGIAIPMTARLARAELLRLARSEIPIDAILEAVAFPIIARPIGSHAGQGLIKLDDAGAIETYLNDRPEQEFFIARFIDYRSRDGLFRKSRIALVGGVPHISHMAISDHWMIHYLNAGMRDSAEKRAEEARFMADFDGDFARRHATAFKELAELVGLDYFAIDCGETQDGKLLLFEVDVAMIVHSMDPPGLFPYKQNHMRKLFDSFQALLHGNALK
jgi:hypothetical protein